MTERVAYGVRLHRRKMLAAVRNERGYRTFRHHAKASTASECSKSWPVAAPLGLLCVKVVPQRRTILDVRQETTKNSLMKNVKESELS